MTLSARAARDALALAEAGVATVDDLAVIHERIGSVAANVADASVAMLSVMPLIARDARALDFVGDAMSANAAALKALVELQAAASRLLDRTAASADTALADLHSRRV